MMVHMYRFMIGDTECGGCVLASNEEEARAKLIPHYADEYGGNPVITIWIDDEITPDIVQVYP